VADQARGSGAIAPLGSQRFFFVKLKLITILSMEKYITENFKKIKKIS